MSLPASVAISARAQVDAAGPPPDQPAGIPLRALFQAIRDRRCLLSLWWRRLCFVLPERRDHAKLVASARARTCISIPGCIGRDPQRAGSGGDRGRRHSSGRPLFRTRGSDPSHFGDATELCLEPAGRTATADMARTDPVRCSRRRAGPRPDPCPWQRDRYTGGAALGEPSAISDDDRDQDQWSAERYDR